MTLTSAQMRQEWSAYECNGEGWATMSLLGRSPVKIIDICRPAWDQFEVALVATGYGQAGIVGSYACRDIAGTSVRSLHAYRLAVDIDPSENARQGIGAAMDWTMCRLTREQADAVESIRTVSGAQVFYAGWRFTNPDPMHFQLACTRADILSGVVPYQTEGDTMPTLDDFTEFIRPYDINHLAEAKIIRAAEATYFTGTAYFVNPTDEFDDRKQPGIIDDQDWQRLWKAYTTRAGVWSI